MNTNPVVIKINSTYDSHVFFNVIFLSIVLLSAFNWYVAVGAVVAVVLLMINRQKNTTLEIDTEKDIFRFPLY